MTERAGGAVIQGPWSSAPVVQDGRSRQRVLGSKWFERIGTQLRVNGGDRWFTAPVPEAKIDGRYPQPNRPPDRERITMALDSRGMNGPEVDEALGVAEPTVDLWETGDIVPSASDMRRVSTLTGYPVQFFYGGPVPKIDGGWMCGAGWIDDGAGCRPLGSDIDDTYRSAPSPSEGEK